MLVEIYMLRLEPAARATATATTSSRFVPITLPALPHPKNLGASFRSITSSHAQSCRG